MGNFFAIQKAIPEDQLWMVIVGFIIAFVLAFGIGANDVANSFGTSVGSRVLSLRQAFVLACIFEMLGAVLLGAKVSDTIRKGIIDIEPYTNNTGLLMAGNVAALSGSCVWLIAATLLRLPVSATHSIVGSTVGFALVVHGAKGIHWAKLGLIVGSWFISPILAGGVSVTLFFICKYFILNKADSLEPGLRFLPVFYAVTIVVNFFSVFYEGPEMLGFHRIPLWGTFVISFGAGTICAIIIRLFVVPWQRKRIKADVYKISTDSSFNDDQTKFVLGAGDCTPPPTDGKIHSHGANGNINNHSATKGIYKNHNANVLLVNEKNGKLCNNMKSASNTAYILSDGEKVKGTLNTKKNSKNLSKEFEIEEKPLMIRNESDLGSIPSKNSSPANLDKDSVSIEETQLSNGNKLTNDTRQSSVSDVTTTTDIDLGETDLKSGRMAIEDKEEAARLFSFLQILTAVFGAFAHGGNDVSNAIGPLVSLWLIGTTGMVSSKAMTPMWILMYGGIGISLGLCVLGRKVIKTIGQDLTKITPSSGFCIEIGSAMTVLIASNIGIPISTTHCKVGSVVFVGRFRSRENVDWSIFRNIVLAWLVTLPISGGISAAIMAGLRLAVDH